MPRWEAIVKYAAGDGGNRHAHAQLRNRGVEKGSLELVSLSMKCRCVGTAIRIAWHVWHVEVCETDVGPRSSDVTLELSVVFYAVVITYRRLSFPFLS